MTGSRSFPAGAFTMTVPVARETLKRVGNKTPHPKIDKTDMNTVWEGRTKEGESPRQGCPCHPIRLTCNLQNGTTKNHYTAAHKITTTWKHPKDNTTIIDRERDPRSVLFLESVDLKHILG
ncbi:hypothetical protein E2C01_062475 [Portunus trituberculatus]|uniref:Uncharacterized protein n=1 Tax=Portunus trituberculatus TaxID=210409 RepID=A0A5B7HG70_PORTR|nr:hypothetical protein [Portunus trituberculatus]